jgi:hypothetical protein
MAMAQRRAPPSGPANLWTLYNRAEANDNPPLRVHAAERPGPADSNVVKRTCSKRSTFWNTRPELVLDNRSQSSNARAGQVSARH